MIATLPALLLVLIVIALVANMARVNSTITVGNQTISVATTRSGATEVGATETLAVAKVGTLSTRTDNNTGILTMAASHGITTGATIDLYWVGGIRRGMTVGTVSVNSVPIDLGAGDNLPAQDTAIVACVVTTITQVVTAASILLVGVGMSRRGSVEFQQSDGTPILSLHLGAADALAAATPSAEGFDWSSSQGVTTPFGADVGKVVISNGSSAGTNVFKYGLSVDNDA